MWKWIFLALVFVGQARGTHIPDIEVYQEFKDPGETVRILADRLCGKKSEVELRYYCYEGGVLTVLYTKPDKPSTIIVCGLYKNGGARIPVMAGGSTEQEAFWRFYRLWKSKEKQ